MKYLIYLFVIIHSVLYFNGATAKTVYGKFYDTERKRDIPYKVYYPDEFSGKCPVVIFSHGLGGSVEAAEYLGEHLSRNGYVCFHIQHEGSDESVWQGAISRKEVLNRLKESLKDISNAVNRFKDIPFAIDEIIKLNRESEIFAGHLDTVNIGMAGHSYGARSVLIASGERVAKGKISFKEARIKCSAALSPNISENPPDDLSVLYKDINIPIFHITGTEDGDPLGRRSDFSPEDRTKPYYNIKTYTQYLLVLNKAVHSTFNGNASMSKDDPYFAEHLETIKTGVLLFFNYYLKQSEADGNKLKSDFVKTLDSKDRFEFK